MNEFMAERATQDICNGITNEYWIPYRNIDVQYSDIFNRKWNYRYSSPQSYLDYFTQQVWNGNIINAELAGEVVERYLEELDAAKAPVGVTATAHAIEEATSETLLEGVGRGIGNAITNLAEGITSFLDRRNRLRIDRD